MKTLLLAMALVVGGIAAAAADTDVTGKWTGSFNVTTPDGGSEDGTAVAVLKQSGGEITGTAGPNEDEQYPINKGKIDGDKITFEVQPHEGQVIRLSLVLAGDRIKGDAVMERDGEKRTAKLEMTRAK
ncbi:MAG: hypothetical protein KGN36_01305 [Acidobacteriota bacterium]|nr:hypothetical protein [Acidobacteriota bacterium]